MTFQPHEWQLAARDAYKRLGGLFLGQPPGAGKTWVIAQCMAEEQRPLVICPRSAMTQTRKYLEKFGIVAGYVTYSQISRDPDLLRRFRPTALAVDEAHVLKNVRSSAWGRRIARHLHEDPACRSEERRVGKECS